MQSNDSISPSDKQPDPARHANELRQAAVLDALGMLDEIDAAQFDRAFRAATPAAQAELRDVQEAAATDPAFLSNDEMGADLKLRTLATVMTAVEVQEVQFAPIAQIGRGPAPSGRRPVRSIDASDLVEQAMALATAKSDVERFVRSSYYWRAAAIALIAALVVVLWFERQTTQSAVRLGEMVLSGAGASQVFDSVGVPELRTLIEQADVVRGLRAVTSDGNGSATVFADSRTGTAWVLSMGLRTNETYQIRVTREDGRKEIIGEFNPATRIACVQINRPNVPVLAAGNIEIIDSRGRVVLSA